MYIVNNNFEMIIYFILINWVSYFISVIKFFKIV